MISMSHVSKPRLIFMGTIFVEISLLTKITRYTVYINYFGWMITFVVLIKRMHIKLCLVYLPALSPFLTQRSVKMW